MSLSGIKDEPFASGYMDSGTDDIYVSTGAGYLGNDVCGRFFGAYIGMFCASCAESENEALFEWFEYRSED